MNRRAYSLRVFEAFLLASMIHLIALTPRAAAVTKVGNGDDGSDLEGFSALENGPIVEARQEALKLVRSLNAQGVAGLGALLPELENSKLYLTKKDVAAVETTDAGAFHADMKGRVYARTFAEPHAATRFFPIAEKLDSDQLVALHVHEALHRALPPEHREDEAVVSAITLSMTSPGASFDTVDRTVARLMPEARHRLLAESSPRGASTSSTYYPIPDSARIKRPSEFGYAYRSFRAPAEPSNYPVDSMHIIRTDLYPFGNDENAVGIGIEAGMIQRPAGSSMGPLALSGRSRLWSGRGFDISGWIAGSLNMLSAEELKNSQFGRDTYSVGLSMRKDLPFFSIENFVGYTLPGESTQKIGNIDYTYGYGGVVTASTHPAILVGPFRLGGFLEVHLADHYSIDGGAFTYDTGRYRLVSGGPEAKFEYKNFIFGVESRFLVNATKEANYDMLGDLMGAGAAQGSVTGTVSVVF